MIPRMTRSVCNTIANLAYNQPGGQDLLDELHGKDATPSFNTINHSDAAFALLDKMEIKGYLAI